MSQLRSDRSIAKFLAEDKSLGGSGGAGTVLQNQQYETAKREFYRGISSNSLFGAAALKQMTPKETPIK